MFKSEDEIMTEYWAKLIADTAEEGDQEDLDDDEVTETLVFGKPPEGEN